MQMDHLPSREVEAPNPIRSSSFVVGVTRGFGGTGAVDGGSGPSSYPTNHYHAVHLPAGTTATAAIPKEERPSDPPSPPPPPPTLPLLDANGPPSPPPPTAAVNSSHVASKCGTPESSSYVYRECLRNHAASLGGNATDGCGEFMPGDPDPASFGDAALICSACGCHRNFHRKELAGGSISHRYGASCLGLDGTAFYPAAQHMQYLTSGSGRKVVGQKGVLISTAAACTALVPYRQPPPQSAMAALPLHAAPAPPESDTEMDHADGGGPPTVLGGVYQTNAAPAPFLVTVPPGYGKKRFRTRFTPEQKKRMLAFAERIGWRLQRRDEGEVQRFCQEIGVKRRVLKVWMHNNKHSRNISGIYHHNSEMISSSNGAVSGDVRRPDIGVVHHDVIGSNHDGHHGRDDKTVPPHGVRSGGANTVVHHHQDVRSHDHDGRDLNQGLGSNHHSGFARIATTSPPPAGLPPHPQPLQQQHHHHHNQHPAIQQAEERSQPASSSSVMIS